MAFALKSKQIKCPNCGFEGKAKIKGSGGGKWILWFALLVISFFFWPLFLVVFAMFLWLVFKPAKQICPKCGHDHPIPQEKKKSVTS